MSKKNSKAGITLIALIITIIVLLILAGITISLVIGDNGIFTNAQESKRRSHEAQIIEEIEIAWAGVQTEGIVEGWDNDTKAGALETELKKEDPSATAILNIDNIDVVYKEYEMTIPVNETTIPVNTITIAATKMSETEIDERGIIRENADSVIIKVTQGVNGQALSVDTIKSDLQALETTNPDKVYRMFIKAFCDWKNEPEFEAEMISYTWEEFANKIYEARGYTVENVEDAFRAFMQIPIDDDYVYDFVYDNGTEEIICNDVYDLIVQSSKKLTFECNGVTHEGIETYFELANEGDYEIVAKDENGNSIATTNYNVIFYAKLKFSNGTTKSLEKYEGKTWYEFATDPNNIETYMVQYDTGPEDLKNVIIQKRIK